ncbi:MAG TPA: hypothetical protein VHF67_09120 [Gaiellaceae bacterium]|nr:hypothetical protein [Gaiellaceae bacterium]
MPETETLYLVPISALPNSTQAALRVDAPRNNQRRRIRMASDYEIARVVVAPPERGDS